MTTVEGRLTARLVAATGVRILATAAAYYGTARAGLLLALIHDQVTPLWLPTGVAVACLLLLGVRAWPGVALAAFAVNAAIGLTLPAVLAITLGNTLAPLGACLLLRWARFDPRLGRMRDTLALVFLGGFAAMLVSASVGTGALALAGVVPAQGLWRAWLVWWTGDSMGVLVGAPLVLVMRFHAGVRLLRERWVEGAFVLVATLAVTLFVGLTTYGFLFCLFPLLLWATLRFERVGAVLWLLTVSVVVTFAAVHRTGQFAGYGLFASMIHLLVLNATAALTALLLATITAQRTRALREVEQAAADLTRMAADLQSGQASLADMVIGLIETGYHPQWLRAAAASTPAGEGAAPGDGASAGNGPPGGETVRPGRIDRPGHVRRSADPARRRA